MESSSNNRSADSRLLEAAAEGKTDLILQLLEEEGSKLHDHKDQDGKTALHVAASNGHVETVAALTLNGADVTAQDHTGHTALQRAAAEGHCAVVQHLIERGAPVDHQDEVHGNTALHEAAWKGFSRTVETLCKNRSNFYLRNRGGFSALHLCCQNGHNESCRVILRAGCKPNIKNNYGDTPLHTASRYGHAGVARILLSAQANPNLQNKNGDSPMHIAAAMGRRKLVRILMETGLIQITATNQQQETPIDIATRKRYSEIIEILKNPPKVRPAGCEDKDDEDEHEVDNQSQVPEKHRKNNLNHEPDGKINAAGKGSKKPGQGKKGTRALTRHRQSHPKGPKDPGWSPYGCHYYPDLNEFPVPRMESLPKDPLTPGEQYYLDLAGNIRKGPVSEGYTCYCTPFIERFEQKLDRNKRDLVRHLESTHGKLAHRISHLERKTRDQISSLSNSMKETIAQERVECQDRVERRAIRDRVAIDRQQAVRDLMLKGDLSSWLDQRLNEVQQCQEQKHREEAALMRTLLRGSRRRKRAIISEMQQTGSMRRALSEDELGPGDIEDNKKQDDAFMMITHLDSDEHENLAVQSEYGGGGGRLTSFDSFQPFGFESLENHLEELRVSDHPHMDLDNPGNPVYQNAVRVQPKSTTVRVRRSSAGDEATLICDFGDFKTQELITTTSTSADNNNYSPGPPSSLSSFHRNGGRVGQDVLNYSTNSESYQGNNSSAASSMQGSHHPYVARSGQIPDHSVLHRLNSEPGSSSPPSGIYQNYMNPSSGRGAPPLMPRPVKPFAPALFSSLHPSLSQNHHQQVYQNQPPMFRIPSKPSPPPRVPPKQHMPPPYRPPPGQTSLASLQRHYLPLYNNSNNNNFHPHNNNNNNHQQLPHQPLQAFFMPPIEEDSNGTNMMMLNPLTVHVAHGAGSKFDRHSMLGMTTTSGALSSSDGGSHDSHNDSGYCAVRLGGGCGGSSAAGSGGPSPSLSGSHGRPDSRGPLSDDLHQQPHSLALRAASIGLLNAGSNSAAVGPRIRQLQQQLSMNNNSTTTTRLPASSLASVSSTLTDNATGIFAPRGSLV